MRQDVAWAQPPILNIICGPRTSERSRDITPPARCHPASRSRQAFPCEPAANAEPLRWGAGAGLVPTKISHEKPVTMITAFWGRKVVTGFSQEINFRRPRSTEPITDAPAGASSPRPAYMYVTPHRRTSHGLAKRTRAPSERATVDWYQRPQGRPSWRARRSAWPLAWPAAVREAVVALVP